jgi:hypothetical protein
MVYEQVSGQRGNPVKRKKPDTLIICGKKRRITYDPSEAGGSCELATGNITVGIANPADWYEILIHEVGELILHTHGHRYSRYTEGNDGLRFVFDHLGYENFIQELAAVLEQF